MDILIRLIADGLVPVIAVVGAYTLIFRLPKDADKLQVYARIVMAGLTSLLAAKLVASFFQPDAARPFVEMGVAPKAAYLDNAGFPSDHVLFTMAIALAVWFETKQRNIAIVLFVLVALVALGRVVALVHTPVDVVGGLVFAFFGSLWYFTNRAPTKRT